MPWPATHLTDLVDVEGSRDAPAAASPSVPRSGSVTFDGDLRRIRRRVLGRWAIAIALRCALGALALTVVSTALAALGVIGWSLAIAIPVGLFLLALGLLLRQPPTLAQVARLLDDRLGLYDVTATALAVERADEPVDEGPAAPVFAEAAALLRAGAESWRPRARIGGREVGVGIGLAVLVAAIAIVGTRSNGGGEMVGAIPTSPGARHKGTRMTNVSPPLAPPRARPHGGRKRTAEAPHLTPLGLYDFGYEGRRPPPKVQQTRHAGLYSQSPGEANEARERAEEEGNGGHRQPEGGAPERGTRSKGSPQTLKSLTGGKAPPAGSVSPLPSASSGARPSVGRPAGGSPPSGAGHSGAAGAGGGGQASTGGGAGHQRAALGREGASAGAGAGAGETSLQLRAGFAAARGGKAARGHGPRNAQGGGGPGRSAGIGGTAFEEGEAGSLGYVPPDAGIAPTLDPGLYTRYLNALAQISGRRW